MKFSQILLGTRAETTAKLRVSKEKTVDVLLRPLNAAEGTDAVSAAIKYAKGKGVIEPAEGHPVYDAALWANTVALACLDADSPTEARTPFFDTGPDGAMTLDTDTLAQLYEAQRLWQEECSPSVRTVSVSQLLSMTKEIARDGDSSFFVQLSPLTRLIWSRTTARLLLNSPELSSLFSSLSESGGTN